MLTRADDYPVHQLPEPIATSGTDRNFYDRYFFNGYTADGRVFFALALGVYPHLNVMDAAFSTIVDGVQHNLRASRLLASERMDTKVGPIAVEVIEPLKRLRVHVSDNPHGITADLLFEARAKAVEEPRFTYRQGPRTIMDYTRLTQNGAYEGFITVKGARIGVERGKVLGTRDRSWGVRPIGLADPQQPAPPRPPQFYWLWSPLNFEDRFMLYHNNADGRAWRAELAPRFNFYMSGIGYTHPEWGHGHWKGENALGYDTYDLATVNENDPRFLHVQAFVEARLSGPGVEREGTGVLEQLVIGPHAPSGFRELLDTAP